MPETKFPQESVYCIEDAEEPIPKPPRYVSKFKPTVVQESKYTKGSRRTMGPAKVELPSPENYLKKHSKEYQHIENSQCLTDVHKKCCCTTRKPAVPARTDNPLMGRSTERKFIKPTLALPMKPQPTSVDTNKGHKQLLENSGLVLKYIKKKDYGEVPAYLLQRNEEELRAQEEYDNYVREEREKRALKALSDEDKEEILQSLKSNWDKLHHDYQGLSLVIDTLSKKSQKLELEHQMEKLEEDIKFLERFKTIYIPNE